MNINTYLTFNGNCRQAMEFYQTCLDGDLSLRTVGESPMGTRLPGEMKDCILHSTLKAGKLILLASDMVSQKGLLKGNSVSLMLECESEGEIRKCYDKLSDCGEQTHPIEFTFWGALLGGLTDKFGNHWLLHFQKNAETLP